MKSFLHTAKAEFKLTNCGLHHHPPEQFVKSQWQTRTKSIVFLLYRWIVCLFFIAVVALSMSTNDTPRAWGVWFIYLTHWGILLCLLTQVLGTFIVTRWYYHPEFSVNNGETTEMPKSFKIYWMLHNTTLILSILITLIYWSVLYNGQAIDATNALTHITNSVLMFFDVLIVSYPIRLLHVIQPILFGLIYCIFSLFYWLCGGTNMDHQPYVYSVLDWSNPGLAIGTTVGCLALALIIHSLLYLIYNLRLLIFEKFFDKSDLNVTSASSINKSNGISMVFGQENHGFTITSEKL